MNFQLSVILICKNEADTITRALQSVLPLSQDIVVLDSGSTDGTLDLVKQFPVRLHTCQWEGFGKTRQKAVDLARHDWVLVVDADEALSPALTEEIRQLPPPSDHTVFRVQLKNHLGTAYVRWGDWGGDYRLRLYNRNVLRWNGSIVHEKLVVPDGVKIVDLENPIMHRTARDVDQFSQKMVQYALLTAEQYYRNGRRSTWLKRHISPAFTFLKNYVALGGFLDGRKGYVIARVISFYTFLKYTRLYELQKKKNGSNF